jgi:hypothetical protein
VHGYAALVRVLGEARTDDEGATRSRSLPAARGHRPKDQTPSPPVAGPEGVLESVFGGPLATSQVTRQGQPEPSLSERRSPEPTENLVRRRSHPVRRVMAPRRGR